MTFNRGKGRGTQYGSDHAAERKRRVMVTVFPGDPCGYCGRPLPADTTTWHLPHKADRSGYLPGMWHGTCNVREAAIRGARTTNARRKALRAAGIQPKQAGKRLTW